MAELPRPTPLTVAVGRLEDGRWECPGWEGSGGPATHHCTQQGQRWGMAETHSHTGAEPLRTPEPRRGPVSTSPALAEPAGPGRGPGHWCLRGLNGPSGTVTMWDEPLVKCPRPEVANTPEGGDREQKKPPGREGHPSEPRLVTAQERRTGGALKVSCAQSKKPTFKE